MTKKRRKRSNKPRKIKKKKHLKGLYFLGACTIVFGFLFIYFLLPILRTNDDTSLVALEETQDNVAPTSQSDRNVAPTSQSDMENTTQETQTGNSWRDIIGFGQNNRQQSTRGEMQEMRDLPPAISPTTSRNEWEGTLINTETTTPPPQTPPQTPTPQTQNTTPRETSIAAATPAPTITERGRMYVVNPNLPKIVIIIDDFGSIGNSLFERFNSLDREIAFAILPGHRYSQSQMERAVASGREVMIHLPMEPEGNERVEQNTIMTYMDDFTIRNQVETWMFELPLVVGVNNHMGSKATQDERVLSVVMQALRQNDLFFIDSHTSGSSRVRQVAQTTGIKTAMRDVFLDVPDSSFRVARQKVDEIKRIRNKDVIIVITHCHNDVKYRQLVHFVDRLKEEGYQLIPPSMGVR